MKLFSPTLLLAAVMAGALPDQCLAQTTYMDLTFDDKTIDAPLGQGGTAIGEATWIQQDAMVVVRAAPFETPSIELRGVDQSNGGPVQFALPTSGISSGLAVIVIDYWFPRVQAGWIPFVEFYSSAWQELCEMTFRDDGSLTISDTELAATIPEFPLGRPLRIVLAMNMDSDTYSVWVDGIERVSGRPLMVAGTTYSQFTIQTGSGASADNRFSIDRILVLDYLPPVPVQPATWGSIKAGE